MPWTNHAIGWGIRALLNAALANIDNRGTLKYGLASLSPSIHKFGDEHIPSGLSAERAF